MIQSEYLFPGGIMEIEKVITEMQAKNILLVRGNDSYVKSGAKKVLTIVLKPFNVVEFSDFSVNPKLEEAKNGYDLFKSKTIDLIIAVGGGSVIDTAKIIKSLAVKENIENTSIPLIAIPTTAGTGTEATHFAVVYIDGEKHSWAHESLLPTVAIVDADLLKGQSKYQMAVSGFDAFSQAIESLWSVNATQLSLEYSEKAIKILWENLPNAINGNQEAIIKIAEGSNLAGKAINIAKTTAPHALSYHITSLFGLPHGHAVALFLPYFITYNFYLKNDDLRLSLKVKENEEILNKLLEIFNIQNGLLLELELHKFIEKLGLDTSFKNIGILEQELIVTLKSANPERLKNNPRIYNFTEFINETSILSIFNLLK